jgi:hypothetical protein
VEQARAAAQTKAAEQARVAAEKQKAIDNAKAADAAIAKAAAQAKAEAAAERAANIAGDNKARDDRPVGPLATLTPADHAGDAVAKAAESVADDTPRLLQVELRRVGCHAGAVDGNWNAAAQRSLGLFNKNAQTKLDVKVASLDALEAVRGKTARVCPLVCEHGYKADGDDCAKITCRSGFAVGDDNTCERIEVKKRERPVANLNPSASRDTSGDPVRSAAPDVSSGSRALSGEPPPGTIRYGERVVVRSNACGRGRALELIGGDNTRNIPRQKRCIAAD